MGAGGGGGEGGWGLFLMIPVLILAVVGILRRFMCSYRKNF